MFPRIISFSFRLARCHAPLTSIVPTNSFLSSTSFDFGILLQEPNSLTGDPDALSAPEILEVLLRVLCLYAGIALAAVFLFHDFEGFQ